MTHIYDTAPSSLILFPLTHRILLLDQENGKETNMSSSEEPLIEEEEEEVEEEEALLNNDDDDDHPTSDEFSKEERRVAVKYEEFSKRERRVAAILLQLPKLITCARLVLIGKSPWLFKKKRSGINILSAPPPSPHGQDTTNDDHPTNHRELIVAGRDAASVKLEQNKCCNLALNHHQPCNVVGLNHHRQDKNLNQELLRTDEVLESLEIDQDEGLPCGDEPPSSAKLEADQTDGPS